MTSSISWSLDRAGARPGKQAQQTEKIQYAKGLSDALALQFGQSLASHLPGIKPSEEKELESAAASARGTKKLDVNYSTPEHGLGLGISIKTISHRDLKRGRYTHNMKRVDEEFLAEAMDYHVRQPYAVLAGVFFLPLDGCDDGKQKSSFGSWVEKLYGRAGRPNPNENPERFERIFVGLFEPSGPSRGDVRFFDVTVPPPKAGRPPRERLSTWDQLVKELLQVYRERNGLTFRWADED